MEPRKDISDLIPKGLGAYWAIFFVFGGFAVLLGYAYLKLPDLSARLGVETIAPLDLASRDNLLNWGVSTLLLLTAAVAWINYRLGRRFKDSFAKSIAWFWAGGALLFLSMDLQVGAGEAIRDILVALSGTALYGNGMIWSLAVYAFVLGVIASRLLVDMASYAPALGLFLLAVAGSVGAVLLHLVLLPISWEETRLVLLQAAMQTGAVLFLLLSFLLFGRRQIFRDPAVALEWFAKVWKQTPLTTPEKAKTAEAKPAPVVATSPVPTATNSVATPSNTVKTTPAKTETQTTKTTATTTARPVVQKQTQTIPFKPADPPAKKNDDDFDLSVIA